MRGYQRVMVCQQVMVYVEGMINLKVERPRAKIYYCKSRSCARNCCELNILLGVVRKERS